MSLTLQRVNSNLFVPYHPECSVMMQDTSLQHPAINKTALKEELTGRWLEDCKKQLQIPFVKRIHCIDSAKLGTTFPPRGGLRPTGEIRPFYRRETFHSEPDLSPLTTYSDDEDYDDVEEDEDHLFEFDMSPEPEPSSVQIESETQDNNHHLHVQVAADSESLSLATVSLRGRTLSDSSSSSCSHRKQFSVETPVEGYRAGFSSIFGSTSSGLGSEKRSSQETLIFGEDENKSFEPSQWRDYMNDRLSYNSEGSSTPLSTSTNDTQPILEDAVATPIMTASPCPPQVGGDSPLISPDSLLDGQHLEESYLAATSSNNTSCPECDRSSLQQELNNLNICDQTDSKEDEESIEETKNIKTVDDNTDNTIESWNDGASSLTCDESPIPKGIKEEDLTQLLAQLDKDTHVYPGLHHVNSTNSSFSQDETEEEISPLRKCSAPANLSAPQTKQSSPEVEVKRLRKCSSLKSGRSPPGTPAERKIVRFADIFGLDLSEVKTFVDEIPKVPRSAFKDLDVDVNEFEIGSPILRPATYQFKPQQPTVQKKAASTLSHSSLVPMFTQPGCSATFYNTVRSNKVCLENAYMEAPFVIAGVVRVLNIDFNKEVVVRWTVNDWHSHVESKTTYVMGSSDGNTDKFSFRIQVGCLPVGSRVQFCLQYCCAGTQFWDNNNGGNYVFQVFLNSNSPGGSGGAIRTSTPVGCTPIARSTPVSVQTRRSDLYNSSISFQNSYTQSPSHHGDDPWMRFM